MNPEEFAAMVRDVRQAEKAIGVVSYGATKQEESNVVFRRSVFCIKDIKKGEKITPENVRVIRPGYGMEPKYYEEILGQVALRDITRGTPMQLSMVGELL